MNTTTSKRSRKKRILLALLSSYQPILTSWPSAYIWVEVVPKFSGQWWNGPAVLTGLALSVTSLALWVKAIDALEAAVKERTDDL